MEFVGSKIEKQAAETDDKSCKPYDALKPTGTRTVEW